jgi:precorrin-2 dehydrogenase/sirohydrochlorin ferrochelatase
MLPLILDMKEIRVGIAGKGEGLRRKRDLVAMAGPEAPMVFEDRLPRQDELASLRILFVVGLDEAASARLAADARARGVLVNVEDQPAFCDFHLPALIRRGDLLITVSTGGRSPAMSSALRQALEQQFGPEWDARLEEVARLRDAWRAEGATSEEVSKRTRAHLNEKGWL